ncbi:hypothetical protein PLICRDRAFT_29188 [Plicaturopsis crispa FD-325 SS-3]|nr:hypothetical protein PLICRDRAFT_29188 [Plicaturopsis crispa FD-325 SS-3]
MPGPSRTGDGGSAAPKTKRERVTTVVCRCYKCLTSDPVNGRNISAPNARLHARNKPPASMKRPIRAYKSIETAGEKMDTTEAHSQSGGNGINVSTNSDASHSHHGCDTGEYTCNAHSPVDYTNMPALKDDDPYPEDANDAEEAASDSMNCDPSKWEAAVAAIAKLTAGHPIDRDVTMQDATGSPVAEAATTDRPDLTSNTGAALDDPVNYRDTLTALMSISLDTAEGHCSESGQPVAPADAREPQSSLPEDQIAPAASPPPPSLPPSAINIVGSSSVNRYWRVVLLLVVWLNLRFHLTVRACLLILKVLKVVLITAGVMNTEDKAPITLSTAYSRLGLSDPFTIVPVCPACKYTHHDTLPTNAKCSNCGAALFKAEPPPVRPTAPPTSTHDLPDEENRGKPLLQCPGQVLSELLPQFVRRHETNCDAWRNRKLPPTNELREIMDGKIWREAQGHDGSLFFGNDAGRDHATELRLGVTLGFDGFGFSKSKHSPSHSSGVLSSCVGNLPYTLRYRPRNLLVSGITPGPSEFTTEQLQVFMKAFVDDLIKLYEEGLLICTPVYPHDTRSENNFCPKCHIRHSELRTDEAMKVNSFPPRSGDRHRRNAEDFRDEPDPDIRADLYKELGSQWFELSRLSYFDAVRMTLIDPMHNILLGLVKNHWLETWIKPNVLRQRTSKKKVLREIDQIHEYLDAFEMPAWVARLPSQVGYPAGGSLTADEYKGLAMVYCPVVLPFVWAEWQPAAEKDYEKKKKAWVDNESKRKKRIEKDKATAKDKKGPAPEPTGPRMHANGADNFLKLAAAMKILLGRSIRLEDLPRARFLLESYLLEYLRAHPDDIKPNHHWVTHIFDQIGDYGPVYNFWCFLFERLNKTLKSYVTNGHKGGELEVSFYRAFTRDAKLRDIVSALASSNTNGDPMLQTTAQLMLDTDGDMRGTVASLAQEMDTAAEETQEELLVAYYYGLDRDAHVIGRAETTNSATPNFVNGRAQFHDHVILDGRRIIPSSSLSKASASIVQADFGGTRYVGQVLEILTHQQAKIEGCSTLLRVRWFRRRGNTDTSAWDPYSYLSRMCFLKHVD